MAAIYYPNYKLSWVKRKQTVYKCCPFKPHSYFCCLFSRSKYAKNEDGSNKFPHIKTDKSQLKRFTLTKKEDLYWKLKQLECEIGLYRTKDDDEVPKESLAVYITINPRNQMKALFKLSKRT